MASPSLKTTLIYHSETQWTDTLPVVLLELRTCFKEDLGTSVVELVYGISLLRSKYRMSTAFFSSEEMLSDPRIFVEDFRIIVLERISDKCSKIWAEIVVQMREINSSSKMSGLKRAYKNIIDLNKKSGNHKNMWAFFLYVYHRRTHDTHLVRNDNEIDIESTIRYRFDAFDVDSIIHYHF
ncbi:hypothetical protein ALC53_07558 [Atta colombica]|uniref:Uncharacterized protein n=1 Tax=Atta colombica TaxID=520822 RepID=A0A195BCT9_9HYME|nr:hypothetical protein ALC53_07558 [Atta colombica]